ncbi:MAG: hypothetical protein JO369_03175 [Paucibacter sp.]|nr:hypothetical protein [Roseateles sp.]
MNKRKQFGWSLTVVMAAGLVACGGGGGGSTTTTATSPTSSTATPQSVTVPVMLSDATSDDWATIGVKVLGIALTKSDGTSVTVPLGSTALPLNLAQLDQLGELLSGVTLNAGDTYTGATLTLSANPGDVSLITSADPEAGFPEAASTAVDSSRIDIQGATGASGAKQVTVSVTFATPLVVPSTPTTALNLEVDLSHPAFLTAHLKVGETQPIWVVNFNGPVKHVPVSDLRRVLLRDSYGKVTAVSSDNLTLTIDKQLPTSPVVSPETAVDTGKSVPIKVDATNGTLFYDLDGKKDSTIKDFSSVSAALAAGNFVRVATRYQQDGSLVATRIWASSQFNTVWISPEGHVLRVNTNNNQILVADENGKPVRLQIAATTQFFFRTPDNALSDTTPIGTGTAFLAANNLVRGFKVHTQVVDPTASPMVAKTIDIETADYSGRLSSVTNAGFIVSGNFNTAGDDYNVNMAYISSATANGTDPVSGAALTGFKFWYESFPTLVDSGANAVSDFTKATGGSVSFGGNYQFYAQGATYARWGDPAQTNGWSAPWVVVQPVGLPLATVSTAPAANATSFAVTVAGGTQPVTVNFSTTPGSATLVYAVDRSNDTVTITPEDITNSTNLAALVAGLAQGNKVKISAVPQSDGTLKAYALTYYTGTQPER